MLDCNTSDSVAENARAARRAGRCGAATTSTFRAILVGLAVVTGFVPWMTGCKKTESNDDSRGVDIRGRQPDSSVELVVESVNALCDPKRSLEQSDHLGFLRTTARDNPRLLLPYLRDARRTVVTSEGPHLKLTHMPYPVWKEIDSILCDQYRTTSHSSMAAAAEYWEHCVNGQAK